MDEHNRPIYVTDIPLGVVVVDTGHEDKIAAETGVAGHAFHSHPFGQLTIVENGLLAADIGSGSWIMPPGRAGWLPPGWPHTGRSFGNVRSLMLYFDADRSAILPKAPTVLPLSPFLTALIKQLSTLESGDIVRRGRLIDVLCDELNAAVSEPLHLPMPRDNRLIQMCCALMENPSDRRDLDCWALAIGMSRRSLSRHMVAETGLSFGRWRTQARLMLAVRMLSEDIPVTDVSLSLGFESLSSFIFVFRRHFGTTPTQFIRMDKNSAL